MKLVNEPLGFHLSFIELRPTLIVIENPGFMAQCVSLLCQQCQGENGDFILSEAGTELKIDKTCQIILDPFHLALNSKRNINLLYKKLATATEGLEETATNLLAASINLLESNLLRSGISNITYNLQPTWIDLYKMLSVQFDEEFENLLDKLQTYLKLMSELGDTRLVIFVGLCAFLNTEEREELAKIAAYLNINLLFLESREPEDYLSGEIRYIIDKDLCLIKG